MRLALTTLKMDPSPTIAIVGRPNVGKSTLFNRLIGKRKAITAKEAGTTRDQIAQPYEIQGYQTLLVDTGGLEHGKKSDIEADVQTQATLAIKDADLILFVVDTINNLTPEDFSAADIIRKSKKPMLLIANKCDHPNIEANVYNIYELGFGAPMQISAIHNSGIEILEDNITKILKKLKFKKKRTKISSEDITPICILGKPNAGKSSLVNALAGSEKIIVSEIPGTTRDSVDIEIKYNDKKYLLTDTAGLRRPGKIEKGIEKFSSLRAMTAIDRSEIVVLLIDGKEGPTHQDAHIAELALEKSKGFILAINKIDLFDEGARDRITAKIQRKFQFIPWAPIIFVSAKNKKNTRKILDLTEEIMEERKKRIPTPQFNTFLQKVTQTHLPASAKHKKPKFFYGSQVDTCPPTFTLFFSNAKNLHFTYPRYLENAIRKEYGFNGTGINIKIKGKEQKKS